MASSLSNLFNNRVEGIHKIKCKYGHDDKKYENCRIKYEYCDCFFEHTDFKIIYVVTKIINKSLMKNYRNDFLIHTNFLSMILINLFYC